MADAPPFDVPIPKHWDKYLKSAFICAVSLVHRAFIVALTPCLNSVIDRSRLQAEILLLKSELALTKEEMRIKDARSSRVTAGARPHYRPAERIAILAVKAARTWSLAQAARAFQVTDSTIANWMLRIDEQGPNTLLELPNPVNRFPDFVSEVANTVKASCPEMGKVRIAQILARTGLHLSPSTVRRMVKKPVEPKTPSPNQPKETDSKSVKSDRTVTAKHPGHTWHIDLTTVPTRQGFWVPWLPFALRQTWPFAYCVFSIVDHFSRKCVLSKAFRKSPTTKAITETLDLAIALCGKAPKYIISDQGTQFRENYELWCDSQQIKPRFGALGQHGSIAVLERFNRTLKDELIRRILVPLRLSDFNDELIRYVVWYNEHRPHQWLHGRTPNEVYESRFPARDGPRIEPRPKYPSKARDGNQTSTLAQRATNLQVVVTYLDDRRHLPIISLKQAA
jgi:transposase InsO family protein